MAEHTLYGKRRLCYTEVTDFTDFQGIGRDPLYKRFDSVYSVIEKNIEPQYRDFLAHPIYSFDDDQILWYVRDWQSAPYKLSDLSGMERARYDTIKAQTIAAYNKVRESLVGEDKQILTGAMKYIDDEFIFCYDNKVVVVAWGMVPDSSKHVVKGAVIHDLKLQNSHKVKFVTGENGTLADKILSVVNRPDGSLLGHMDLPQVIPNKGYAFVGWDPNPIGMKVLGPLTFTAMYQQVGEIEQPKIRVSFVANEGGFLNGTTEYFVERGSYLQPSQIPYATPHPGYVFAGWNMRPDVQLNDNITFCAIFNRDEVKCKFVTDECGSIQGMDSFVMPRGSILRTIPTIKPRKGYKFLGWDKSPINYVVNEDTTFFARYEKILPWYKRFWAWLTGKGCLKWLLWTLLGLLLLALLGLLIYFGPRIFGLGGDPIVNEVIPIEQIPGPDGEDIDDNQFRLPDGTIPVPPKEPVYGDFNPIIGDDGKLPDETIVAPIIDDGGEKAPIIKDPDRGRVIANRLAIFFDDANVNLNRFVEILCKNYECEVIGMDRNIPMIQIQVPQNKRVTIKDQLNNDGIPGFSFFVVDEQIVDKRQVTETAGLPSNSTPLARRGWHLEAVKVRNGWRYTKGDQNVIVAVVDDGLDGSHELFKDRIVKPYNIYTKNNRLSNGTGHGTHVAGLAVGSDAKFDNGVSGIAPNCKLMPVQVFDNKLATTSSLASGVVYAINNGADVINASFGICIEKELLAKIKHLSEAEQEEYTKNFWKEQEKVWKHIIKIAQKHNAIIVFAAGNDNILAKVCPTVRSNATINVAAINSQYNCAHFSNYGKGSNISAPGQDIYSSIPVNRYGNMEGTSMAAPIVAGAVALMKSIKKDLTAEEALQILRQTGRQISGSRRTPPMVQIDAALAKLANDESFTPDPGTVPEPAPGYKPEPRPGVNPAPSRDRIIVEPDNPYYERIRRILNGEDI